MATIDDLSTALINADKAGDADAARALAAEITRMRSQAPAPSAPNVPKAADPRDNAAGKLDTFVRGAADTLSLGLADEIAAQAKSGPFTVQKPDDDYYKRGIYAGDLNPLGPIAKALNAPFASETKNADYDKALAEERATDDADAENRSGYRVAGQIAGGVTGGVGLAKNGLSAATNAANRGAGLMRVGAGSLVDGAVLGGAQGVGSGRGLSDRVRQGTVGLLTGGAIGGITPLAVAGASKVLKSAVAPIAAPFMPETYADDAIATARRRSGQTPEQVGDAMRAAALDDQGMFNVGDAMGYTGERLMSTVARTPHNERQAVAEALQFRQAGQGERLANHLAEGFDTFDTAAARTAQRTADRGAEANRLYAAARRDAGAVNVTPVLEEIDRTVNPGVNQLVNPRDRIANDSIEGALSRVRSMLSDGQSQVTDFDTLFRAKLDIDDMIQRAEGQGAGNRAHYLSRVQGQIDDALAASSPSYAQARDSFAAASRRIDAVETGRGATRISRRAQDTIPEFNALSPGEQVDFRAGYVDPLIAKVEGMSSSPTTNKARVFQTPKYDAELNAFTEPERGQQLARRIGREQRMFETTRAALGGSKTADNMADAADMAKYDPSAISKLVRGDYIGALTNSLAKALGAARGMPPSVSERVARALIETNPELAVSMLTRGSEKLSKGDRLRSGVAAALIGSGTAGAGRM